MQILIRNLSRSTTEEAINALFSEIGTVTTCSLVLDQKSGKSKGFAFVEMPNEKEGYKAIAKLNQSVVDKMSIRVKLAE